MKRFGYFIISLLATAGIIALAVHLWIRNSIEESNTDDYAMIGDIPTPEGYERVNCEDFEFGAYLRSLPLKPQGAIVKYYYGGIADLQELNYAVVDLPLLSNAEQCADVCMRLRAEYLYQIGRASDIHFLDVQGNVLTYSGEDSRESLEDYLRGVFRVANTYSLCQEMQDRTLADIQPGDVFVYPANSERYGHAVMVADVAQKTDTGEKAILLVEGYLPARSIHVMNNLLDSIHSPWFLLDEDAESFDFSLFHFEATELKCFSE